MPRPGHPLDFDWRRISKWCLIATIAMVLYLLWPVAKCSFGSFRDTPLNDVEEAGGPGQADKNRVDEGKGFFMTWLSATKVCYDATPLTGQEAWKTYVLFSLIGLTVVTKGIAYTFTKRHGI